MSEESGFFTSVAGDRKYTARFMNEKMNDAMQGADGVIANVGGELIVTGDGSLSVNIAPGSAIKKGVYYRNEDNLRITLLEPTLGKKRYDRIAIRIDHYRRKMVAKVLQGNESTEPIELNYGNENDIALAKVLIDHTEDPVVVTVTDERQMRPIFLTNMNSIDELKEGEIYGKVKKEKANALNNGQLGINMRQFIFVSRPWHNEDIYSWDISYLGEVIIVSKDGDSIMAISDDAGLTWKNIKATTANGIPNDLGEIKCMARCSDNAIFGGGTHARILRSTNNASTCVVKFEDTEEDYVSALLTIDNHSLIGFCGKKVIASNDCGMTWTQKASFIKDLEIEALENIGNGVILAAGHGTEKIWRSTDSGATWTAVKTTEVESCNASFLKHIGNGIVLLGYSEGYRGSLYRSTDYGLTWDDGIRIDNCSDYRCILMEGETIYISIRNKIFASEDKGVTWELKYAMANCSEIYLLGKRWGGIIYTIGADGHVFWGYPMTA